MGNLKRKLRILETPKPEMIDASSNTQVSEMDEVDKKWICNHLGSDYNTLALFSEVKIL